MVQQLLEMPTLEDSSLVIFTSLALDRVDLLQEQGTQVFTKWINSMSAWGGCWRETRQKKLSNWSWAQHSKEKDTLSHEAAVKALSPKGKTQTDHPHNFGYLVYINLSLLQKLLEVSLPLHSPIRTERNIFQHTTALPSASCHTQMLKKCLWGRGRRRVVKCLTIQRKGFFGVTCT